VTKFPSIEDSFNLRLFHPKNIPTIRSTKYKITRKVNGNDAICPTLLKKFMNQSNRGAATIKTIERIVFLFFIVVILYHYKTDCRKPCGSKARRELMIMKEGKLYRKGRAIATYYMIEAIYKAVDQERWLYLFIIIVICACGKCSTEKDFC